MLSGAVMKALRRKLSYANVTATLALVFAMSGGALAAKHYLLNSTSQVNPRVLQIAGNDRPQDLRAALPKRCTVAGAINAGSATNASHAESASTAGNALSLGEVPAADFTRSDCTSQTGQVKGFALVPASSSFPERFTSLATAYNCSGRPSKPAGSKRASTRSTSSATPSSWRWPRPTPANRSRTPTPCRVKGEGPGDWRVAVYDVATGKAVDDAFELLVP